MTIRYGGAESPEGNGFRMTVEAPAGTSLTQLVLPGQMYKLGGTDADGSGYKAVALATGDDPGSVVLLRAVERKQDVSPMTVQVIGYDQIVTMSYVSGNAPTLGQSVEATDPTGNSGADAGKIKGKAFAAGESYVCMIDTVNLQVEVLC